MLVRTSKDKDHPYVMLNKMFLEDHNLSLKAKGLLAYCMSKPDGWQFHVNEMTKVLKEGRDSINSAFRELIKYGYCIRKQERLNGQFDKGEYILFEVPEKPYTEKAYTVKAESETSQLVINESSNNESNNNTPKGDIAQTATRLRYDISFSFESSSFKGIKQKDKESWKELYPNVDIDLQLKKMQEWIISNPSKAKNKKNWRKFINNWLTKTNEESVNKQAYKAASGSGKSRANLGGERLEEYDSKW